MIASTSFSERRPFKCHSGGMADRKVDIERGERIKYVRVEILKIRSQERFAEVLSHETGQTLTRGAVGNWELGKEIGLNNLRAIAEFANVSLDWLAYNSGDKPEAIKKNPHIVNVMGYLGAGAEIEPEYEQVPPDGIEQYVVPFPLPSEMIAFKVKGISMLPVFKPDSIIIVYNEQKRPIESFYGEEAAVRTSDGRRFIKTINKGSTPGTVNLISWNDQTPIEAVRLEWIGEIFAVMSPAAVRQVQRQGGVQGQLHFPRSA